LAPPARCRFERRTSDDLRPLRREPFGSGRNEAMGMTTPAFSWRESGIRWLWIAVAAIVLDQITKWWIATHLVMTTRFVRGDVIEVLPVLNIIYTVNTGAAWSFGEDTAWGRWLFTGLAIVVSVVLFYWLRRLSMVSQKLLAAGLTLILGGAIGNANESSRAPPTSEDPARQPQGLLRRCRPGDRHRRARHRLVRRAHPRAPR